MQVVRPFAREGGVGYGNIGRVVELAIQEVQVRGTLTTLQHYPRSAGEITVRSAGEITVRNAGETSPLPSPLSPLSLTPLPSQRVAEAQLDLSPGKEQQLLQAVLHQVRSVL